MIINDLIPTGAIAGPPIKYIELHAYITVAKFELEEDTVPTSIVCPSDFPASKYAPILIESDGDVDVICLVPHIKEDDTYGNYTMIGKWNDGVLRN